MEINNDYSNYFKYIKEDDTAQDVTPYSRKRNEADSANGEIDSIFGQGNLQDCALLSTVYGLSLTEKGSDAIRDAISIDKDENGNVTGYNVTFKGTGESYHITQDELDQAKTKEDDARKYSYGDDDMTILELALEDCFEQSEDQTLRYLVDNYTDLNADDKLHGVNPASVTYLLTGEKTEWYDVRDEDKMTKRFFANENYTVKTKDGNEYFTFEANEYYKLLGYSADKTSIKIEDIKNNRTVSLDYDDFINNAFKQDVEDDKNSAKEKLENFSDDSVMVFAVKSGNNIVKGSNGEDIELSDSSHAYAVSNVKDGIVTLVNPWNSGEPLQITMESLLNLNEYYVYSLDFDN